MLLDWPVSNYTRETLIPLSRLFLLGFDYSFSAIQNGSNELFNAYKDMFEVAVSRGETLWDIFIVYFPWLERILVSDTYYFVETNIPDTYSAE